MAEWAAKPDSAAAWDGYDELDPGPPFDETDPSFDPLEPPPPDWHRAWRKWVSGMLPAAADLLAGDGIVTDQASTWRLAELLVQRLSQARAVHSRRRAGDYSPDPLPATFPVLPPVSATPPAPVQTGVGMSLADMWNAWKAVAVVKPRSVADTRYVLDMLAAFLGHSDAARIEAADLRRWRDASKAEGLTNNTWNNRLSAMRPVFAFAVANGHLPINPADNSLRLAKSKGAERLPYSDADAVRILLAAREETAPAKRWAHWVMAFSGMRVAEVLQMTAGDVRQEAGIWFMAVHEDDPGKSVKTGNRRSVPVHPALIAEGFLTYVATRPAAAALFPDKQPDKFGNRGGRGWNAVGKWVRNVAGITDPKKAPNHSWRHRIEDELRAAEVPEDARDAIVGHARQTTGRSYGVRGEALARLHRELARIPVPPGLFSATVPSDTPKS